MQKSRPQAMVTPIVKTEKAIPQSSQFIPNQR